MTPFQTPSILQRQLARRLVSFRNEAGTTMTMSAEIADWREGLEALHTRIAQRFRRAEARGRAKQYLVGLLDRVERKNGWQLADHAGESRPDGMQHLLNSAVWDADLVRDESLVPTF